MARRATSLAVVIGVAASASMAMHAADQTTPGTSPMPVASHQPAPPALHRALLDEYCVACHNQRSKTAGLAFDALDLAEVDAHAPVWEKTIRKVRAGMMPPPGRRRPSPAATEALASWLERTLDEAAARAPNPGRVGLRRLNRFEYGNAVEDLLGIRVDVNALLPKDEEADGFDNVATALRVSPSFLDQYISAARLVGIRAMGNPAPKPASAMYRPARGADQSRRVEGLPPGTRGGLLAEHLFPADGEYRFNVAGLAFAFYMRGLEYQHTVVLTIDGVRIFEGQIGGEEDLKAIDQQQAPAVGAVNARFQNITARVTAGPHEVGVTFVARGYAESDELLYSFRPGVGEDRIARIAGLEIVGPFSPGGVSDTPSRRRIFVCRPSPSATAAVERACATRIVSSLARRAYRRPIGDADLAAPLSFFDEGRAGADFDAGIQNALTAILASPKFLFRAERVPESVAAGSVHRVDDLELASRLSFFLAGRHPDDELIDVAVSGTLQSPSTLDQQVRRLLRAPAARAVATNFAVQWLKLRAIDDVEPDGVQFPSFDATLREAFKREAELFVSSIVAEDRSVVELLTADHTYVNERLALHYGLPQVRGEAFQRVTLSDPNRRGLLGKGAVLMATSYGNRTAPVIRGAWILETLIGTPPAPPPPDVEGFKENEPGKKARTVREILEEHRRNPACNSCHAVLDPLGFALENFDAIGAWRTVDRFAGAPVDASGQLIDGTTLNGPADLARALAAKPAQFVQTFTEKLMTYALGRTIEAHDMPAVRKIVRDAAPDGYKWSAIVMGIVRSVPFQMRKSASDTEAEGR
jgi:mono/diheme cytochrome c family protein